MCRIQGEKYQFSQKHFRRFILSTSNENPLFHSISLSTFWNKKLQKVRTNQLWALQIQKGFPPTNPRMDELGKIKLGNTQTGKKFDQTNMCFLAFRGGKKCQIWPQMSKKGKISTPKWQFSTWSPSSCEFERTNFQPSKFTKSSNQRTSSHAHGRKVLANELQGGRTGNIRTARKGLKKRTTHEPVRVRFLP